TLIVPVRKRSSGLAVSEYVTALLPTPDNALLMVIQGTELLTSHCAFGAVVKAKDPVLAKRVKAAAAGVKLKTGRQAENSEVLLAVTSVAVAVTKSPAAMPDGVGKVSLMVALPPLSVVTLVNPRNLCPSPLPLGSHAVFAKNSIR